MQTSQRGTVQHEIFVGEKAVAFNAGEFLELRVSCRPDAGDSITGSGLVRYGLAVSLEVSPSLHIDIHEQVANALRTRVRPSARTRVPTS